MGILIQVHDDRLEYLSENIEDGLRALGNAMKCISEMKDMNGMGKQRDSGWNVGRREYGRHGSQMGENVSHVDPMYM